MAVVRAVLFACIVSSALASADQRPSPRSHPVEAAIAWYDTLGFPDAAFLPYVRVATGRWRQEGNQPPENQFIEGFLLREDTESFTVFLCNVSRFAGFGDDYPSYATLTTVRFVRKETGPAHEQVRYEREDFPQVASAVLARVRSRAEKGFPDDAYPYPVTARARIFTFGRAVLQQGLADTGNALLDIAAAIPTGQTGRVQPERLRELLQQQIGDAVLTQAERDAIESDIPWAELLKAYDGFEARFPASSRTGYARDAANTLRRMIADEPAHKQATLERMSASEQAAEHIYRLRALRLSPAYWHSGQYPVDYEGRDGKTIPTPVHRLIDLGNAAIPQLIEALDDDSFTRTAVASFNGTEAPKAMRVSDFAENILTFISGRNFSIGMAPDGTRIPGTVRQRAAAWFAEAGGKGERQQLIDDVSAGDDRGLTAARRLVDRYPDAAIAAIEVGIRATRDAGTRGEYVRLAARLAGDEPVALLRFELAGRDGIYAQVQAAGGLLARSQPEAVPAMIEAWRVLLPRLPGAGLNNQEPYRQASLLIGFLATCGDVKGIEALGAGAGSAPVDIRLAAVEAFVTRPRSGGGQSTGLSVSVVLDPDWDPPASPEADAAIRRLLFAALVDRQPRLNLQRTYDAVTMRDPRIADMAAFALAKRWPARYTFAWSPNVAERDAQIEIILLRKAPRQSGASALVDRQVPAGQRGGSIHLPQ